MKTASKIFFLVLSAIILSPGGIAKAGKKSPGWKDIYPGAKLLKHVKMISGEPVRFYAVSIDLTRPGTEVVVSPPKYKGAKTSKFVKDMGAQVGINGGFWTLVSHKPLGLVVSAGRKWPEADDDKEHGFLAVTKEGRAWVSPPEELITNVGSDLLMAMPGTPMIVRSGEAGKVRGCGYVCMKHPRAAVGVDRAGETLTFVVADGRQEESASIKLKDLADFMIELGVWDALNLDGGGSATLFVENRGGVVNNPCEGSERSVINSIAVIFRENEEDAAAGSVAAASIVPPARVAGEAPSKAKNRIRFSDSDFVYGGDIESPPRMKKITSAAGAAGILFLVVALSSLVIVVRKRRKKRS
ncbi:MAG: phosphodiester glycosidase family protein [Pseudomonadota bacterium]